MREKTKIRCLCCWPGRGRAGKKMHARIVRRRSRRQSKNTAE